MLQTVRHVRTACSYVLLVGIAVGIYCQAAAVTALAQDNTSSAPPISTPASNASYNYSVCDKLQNKDVVSDEEEKKALPIVRTAAFAPPMPSSSNLSGDTVFDLINNFRKSNGLAPFEKDANLCSLAATRATEGYNEIFVSGNIHGGLYARHLPYWITENMKYGPNESDVFNWWMGSYIHHKAIVSEAKYACGACSGNTCVMEFTSYIPK